MHGSLFSGILSEPSPDKYFASLDKGRKNENNSTYLIDGAMWNTCKESRRAIQKHYSQYKWPSDEFWYTTSDARVYHGYPYHKVFQVPSTGYFEGDSPHYLTIFPRRDLFVFQPDKLDGVDWYFVGSRPTKGDNRPACRRLQHIAIEYNPEWSFEQHEPSYLAMSHLVEAAYELKDIQKLWFIDHSLKRKKDAPAFNEKAECPTWRDACKSLNAFYARDRKFLEIDWRSSCGPLEDWDYVKPVGDKSNQDVSSSINFMRKLNELAWERYADPRKCHYRLRDHMEHCGIGLLGWDDL
ncbi:hypothetical protein FAGAP_4999 [Fusarium agapanthi]|uniref:Uncharacterized protein n=1 Tax=Fusarium agapanthi TaxID=1803897 RepID=A0A9P5EF59_9HYPO|nr:hypothetical protein FAGAP_4999 [Fusarium agapanthi]